MQNGKTHTLSSDEVWDIIKDIPDPEIPVITIEELGVLRKVDILDGNEVVVTITPTYSGCPAMKVFEDDILQELKKNGIEKASIKTVYNPAWTTDWISDEAREKMQKAGIAPPVGSSVDKASLLGEPKEIPCPQCGSKDTKMISQFGSTACKALYKCNSCYETFDYFKCI